METTESFSIKLEQILPWQDGQYAEVFLGIRDYDEISAKMSEEVKNSLLYHLGTHIQKHLKGQEMVCHVKRMSSYCCWTIMWKLLRRRSVIL